MNDRERETARALGRTGSRHVPLGRGVVAEHSRMMRVHKYVLDVMLADNKLLLWLRRGHHERS